MNGAKGPLDDERYAAARRNMVAEQLARRGIRDPRVLAAMGEVPRHRFVDPALVGEAYEDRPLSIGYSQTISQPFMVARVTELAATRANDRVLEVGAGCGYQAAVLARLVRDVFAVEVIEPLAARAGETLRALGVSNVTVDAFDGGAGWRAHAPYDAIIVSAGAPRVPPMLVDQLADGGRLVIPVGSRDEQVLSVIHRIGDRYETTLDTRCKYVDLVGHFGVGADPPTA
jgi:protein-L-isoaspartate(D-aspartate) O-methyltransferase